MSTKARWHEWEDAVLRRLYQPERKSVGVDACVTALPHRTRKAIHDRARNLGISLSRTDTIGGFFRRVQITPGCWLWKGATDDKGYGCFFFDGKKMGAHRASYLIHHGQIEDGLFACHRCDNPLCVNPDHLFAGTHQGNMRDMVSKGRGQDVYGFSGRSKLSDADVREIRESGLRNLDLAIKFNVSASLVSHIRAGRIRKTSSGGAAC